MNAKEAREILKTTIVHSPRRHGLRTIMKLSEAEGYLAALEGREVKALAEALELEAGFDCVNAGFKSKPPKDCSCGPCQARKALIKYQEAISGVKS